MPSAGAVCPPLITPLRKHVTGMSTNKIDTTTLIEITCDTEDTKIYFTADGSKPNPFQRKVGGKEVVHRYTAPFTLNAGKRTLKAAAVTRDGLRESDVITKNFVVEDIGKVNSSPIPYFTSDLDTTDFFDDEIEPPTDSTMKTSTSKSSKSTTASKSKPKRSKSPKRSTLRTRSKSPVVGMGTAPKEAWASAGYTSSVNSGAFSEQAPQIPDGPFNPTNYSGTQINVWGGAPPPYVQGGMPGAVNLGPPGICNPYTTQYGYLTESMLQNCNPDTKHVTVGDLRQLLKSRQPQQPQIAAPPPPAPEPEKIEVPVYKDPPLNAVSPGGGDFKGNLLHVYAHMLDFAKSNKEFRLPVSEPKIGKMLEASFKDDQDCYEIKLIMAKPGVPRGSIRKTAPVEKKKKKEEPPPKKEVKKKEEPPKPKPKPKNDPYFAMETEDLNQEGTVIPYPKFNAENDAEVLYKAMKGLGTDEASIINVLCYRSSPQRVKIVETYKTMFGKDLVEDLKGDLSGHFLSTMKCLCMGPAEFDAHQLHKAMKGLGTDEDVLIEIICTRSNAQLTEVKKFYREKYGRELEKDIISDTSGHFKKLMVSLVQANRSDSKEVDRNKANQDAKELYQAGEKKWGTDESKFNTILVTRSYPQLRATFEEYQKISKKSMEEALKSEMSGDLLRGMLTIVRCVQNKFGHFARQIQKTMKGLGTDDDTLVRVIVSRCEIDLVNIKQEFEKLTGQQLAQFITDDTSGDYRDSLLSLVNGGPPPEMAAKSGKGFVEAVKNKTEEELDEEVKMESEPKQEDPTLVPAENFNAEADAQTIRKAVKGFGTDEKAIISVLGYRSNDQMVQVYEKYKTMFGKDLIKDLEGDLSGNFEKLCVGLCLSSTEFDATSLRNAIKVFLKPHPVDILVKVYEKYKTMFGKDLIKDLEGDLSGNFEKLCVGLCLSSTEFDATSLRNAIKVFLNQHPMDRLVKIYEKYNTMFGKDLIKDLEGDLSGNFEKLCVGLCLSSTEFDATSLRNAIKGLGTDEDVLTEIICTRSNQQLKDIKALYKTKFGKDLEADVKGDTSGDYQRILIACLQANRDESNEFDRNKAKQDAQALHEAGEKKWGTDEARFNAILASRSYAQLRATFQEYAKVANKDIEDSIKDEFSGDVEKGMLSIVRCIRSKASHFATQLHDAIKGLGTDDSTVVRVLVSRAGVDMIQIKEEFQRLYKQTLGMYLVGDLSGDYLKLALALIRDENAKK